MNWKPIPKEEPALEPKQNTHVQAKFVGTSSSKNNIVHPNISYRLFQKTSGKLIDFVKKERAFKINELSDLIVDLQKTVSKLQQKRLYLLQKEARKNSRKNF
jgi:hypothetical protein